VKGDVIVVGDDLRRAGFVIADRILPAITARPGRYAIAVAGESGSGKSAAAQSLAEALDERGLRTTIFQQDDYFIYPPKTNDTQRRRDIGWVGPQEVRLDLLDQHLKGALEGAREVNKPLVVYEEDRVGAETACLDGVKVVVAEGTYTMLLQHVDARIFIARTWLDTVEGRRQRGRERPDPFIDAVLTIEHRIISAHQARADIVITREFEVEFPRPVAGGRSWT
jgi:uridine kinase